MAVVYADRRRDCVRCTCDDPEAQVDCAGYEWAAWLCPGKGAEQWCRFNFDAFGNVTDDCHCPGILAL